MTPHHFSINTLGKIFSTKSGGGFTLIEVMFAISVLTIAVGGSFALIQQTLISASMNQSELVASYLTQEGIEIVRNIRDNNWLEQRAVPETSWDDGLTVCQDPNCCEGDYKTDIPPSSAVLASFSACDFNNLHYLNIDENGFYGYSGATSTNFKRKINVTKVDTNTLEVSVEVQWSERGRTHNIKAQDYLYNWYGYEKGMPQICYLGGFPQTCEGAEATALGCTAGQEAACRRCDNGKCGNYTSGQHGCSSGKECDSSGQCVVVGCKSNGDICTDGSYCCSGNCYVDSDGDGYAGTLGTETCRASASLGTDLDDSDVCTDTVIHSCGQVSGGSCVPKSAGEQSQAACKRCSGISIDVVNITDNTQDTEGSNLCDANCKKCSGGSCVDQNSGEDLFSQCSGLDCDGGATKYYYGWSSNTCYYRADVSDADAVCNESGSCKTAADQCPSSGQGLSTGVIRTTCKTQVGCSGTIAGSLGNVASGIDDYNDCDTTCCYTGNCDGFGACVGLNCKTSGTISGDTVYCDNSNRLWTPTAVIGGSAKIYAWGGSGTDEQTNSCIGIASRPACNYCDNLTYAGYTDWVLPSCVSGAKNSGCILYQFGIDACGSYGCTPTWDTNAKNTQYWSSSEYSSANAWQVRFSNGNVSNSSKSTSYNVRCVRGQ